MNLVKGQLVLTSADTCASPRTNKNWVKAGGVYPHLKKGTIGVYLYTYQGYEVVYFPSLGASYGVYDYEIKRLESCS